MKTKTKIDKKNKFKGNPRKISKKEYNLLKDHLEELGDLAGVVYCQNNKAYVGGNQRSEVFNGSEIEVVESYEKPTKHHTVALGFIHYNGEKYAYREVNYTKELFDKACIVANSDGGSFDWDILENEWDTVSLGEWGLDTPGDEAKKEDKAEEDNFVIPEEIKTDIKLGDIIEIGVHRLMCGDSTLKKDVDYLMNNQKADMIWTDPPYGINEKGDRSKRGGLAKGNNLPDFKDDSISYAIKAFKQPINKDIKIQLWFGANYYCHSLPQSANWLVWDKRVEDNQRDYNSDCELAWVRSQFNSIRIFRHLWKGMLKGSEHGEKRVHATQKPIALVDYCIKEYCEDAKIILDYFGGSGVCMVASHQLKKTCFTMEYEPHNCQVIVDRMLNLDSSLTVKINGKKYINPNK